MNQGSALALCESAAGSSRRGAASRDEPAPSTADPLGGTRVACTRSARYRALTF